MGTTIESSWENERLKEVIAELKAELARYQVFAYYMDFGDTDDYADGDREYNGVDYCSGGRTRGTPLYARKD